MLRFSSSISHQSSMVPPWPLQETQTTHTLQRHPSCGAKSFNQVPEDSQLPSEVKFDKKGIEKGDDSPLGSIKAKQADPTLPQGL